MLREFITSNRSELVRRCRSRVARRRAPRATPFELEHGIPIFIDQLAGMLPDGDARDIPKEGDGFDQSAARHGEELLRHGFTIDQVVHDYGDLCQSITELANEKGSSISVPEFATLNMRLDNAIASAVLEWTRGREETLEVEHAADTNQALGVLAHELRNNLNTAILAIAAMKGGGVGMTGATAAALDRSLIGMRDLIDRALTEVRLNVNPAPRPPSSAIELSAFITEVQVAAAMEATSMGRDLTVLPVEPGLFVQADRSILAAALANLLQNAFKFTRKGGHVVLRTTAVGGKVLIAVEDECGGLPDDVRERIFKPFEQVRRDPRGVGLGLAISRRGVEANGGRLGVHNVPGTGCVFTIELPRVDGPTTFASEQTHARRRS
jgi:signal transduction histidine kinase